MLKRKPRMAIDCRYCRMVYNLPCGCPNRCDLTLPCACTLLDRILNWTAYIGRKEA